MGTAKKIVQRLVTKSNYKEVEVQTKTIGELMQEYLAKQTVILAYNYAQYLESIIEKTNQKLRYEESLHLMTKDKLTWISKDKFKLQKLLTEYENTIKNLQEKYKTLNMKHLNTMKEFKDVEYEIKSLEKGKAG